MSGTTLTINGTAETSLVLDPSIFTVSQGTLTILQTAFSGLSTDSSLSANTQLLVVEAGTTPYAATLKAIATEIAVLNAPSTITVKTIPAEYLSTSFTVSGTLTNYSAIPTLTYEDNASGYVALPTGATVTETAFSFTHPGLSTAGTYTVSVKDSTGIVGKSNSFTVTALAPPKIGTNSVAVSLYLDASVTANVCSNATATTPQTTNGGAVEGWKDSSSNAYIFGQATAANAPALATAAQNNLQAVQFSSNSGTTADYMTCSTTSLCGSAYSAVQEGGAGLTVALTFKQTTASTAAGPIAYFGNGVTFLSIGADNSGDVNATYTNKAGNFLTFQPTPTPGKLIKAVATFVPGSTTGSLTLSINGTLSSSTYDFDPNNFTSTSIGNIYENTGFPVTDICEMDVWYSSASTSDLTAIETYLTQKWGS